MLVHNLMHLVASAQRSATMLASGQQHLESCLDIASIPYVIAHCIGLPQHAIRHTPMLSSGISVSCLRFHVCLQARPSFTVDDCGCRE